MHVHHSLEGLSRACARHPWRTLAVWLGVLLLAAGLILGFLGSALTTQQTFTGMPESRRADLLLEQRLTGPLKAREIVIVRNPALTVDDPAFRQETDALYRQVMGLGPNIVQSGVSYTTAPLPGLVSADRHGALLVFTLSGTIDKAGTNVTRLLNVTQQANGQGGFQVLSTGLASIGHDFRLTAERDLRAGEVFGVAVALVILLLVFGTGVAALIPVGLALVAISVAIGLAAVVGQFFQLSYFVTNMITMMGLAVGIDYSLFVVSRYREERRAGRGKVDAVARTGGTAGRSVLFSGMTVILALAGLLMVPTSLFRSLAIGAILVVGVAVAGALTLLPAVLGLLGDRVNALPVPFLHRDIDFCAPARQGGFWDRVTHAVMRRPVVSVALATLLLLAAGAAALNLRTGSAGVTSLPEGTGSRLGFQVLQRDFSTALLDPVQMVIDGNLSSSKVQQALRALEQSVARDPSFGGVLPPQANRQGDLLLASASLRVDPNSSAGFDAVRRLRDQYIPPAFAGSGAAVFVTGATAQNVDFFSIIDRYTPWVFALVLGLSFVLLTVLFRSLVVPLKALVMNLLSVGAAYGLIVLAFQQGWGARVFGFQRLPFVDAWIPLFLFSVLFGLSMDYHVFLLSRIRERYDLTGDNAESVAYGLRTTAGIITGAAVIMVAVFSGFAAGRLVIFQQLGFGLAVAVLLDATVVRSVLVPAAMKLLGNANWYLPRNMRWLPDMRVEPQATPALVCPDEDMSRTDSP